MNQKCYIISYEPTNVSNLTGLQTAIKAYGTWAKITETTWAIVTMQSASEVRTNLGNYVVGGRMFVVKSGIEAAWTNVHCTNEWLKNNL